MITREQLSSLYDMAISGSEDPDSSKYYCDRMAEFIGDIIDAEMTADFIADIGGEEGLRKAIAEAEAGPGLTVEEFMEKIK